MSATDKDPKAEAEEISQVLPPSGDAPRFQPQLAPARTANWPETSYETGLRLAREILDQGGKLKEPTIKMACFIQAVLDGASQSEAFRFAYDCPHEKPSLVSHRASTLMKRPEVAYEIFCQRRRAEERLLRDRTQAQKFVIEHLQRVVETPGSHHAARVNALGLLGKYAGMFGTEGSARDSTAGRDSGSLERQIMAKLKALGAGKLIDVTPDGEGISGLGKEGDEE
jgi:hypothetical protein